MKKLALCTALLLISSQAFANKPCEELKSEIAAKLDAKKVQGYSLTIIAKDASADGTVVGSCDSGKQSIVYKKGTAEAVAKPATDKPAAAAAAAKPALEKPAASNKP